MSYSSAPMMQAINPMKKKVLSALVAVVIGHVGVLWAVSTMKSPELKPIEKEPLKVRFVNIQQQAKALPPEPKAEPKQQEPKPAPAPVVKEVKVVDTPPPPKKIEKVQQVTKAETAKPVAKPVEAPVTVKAPPVVTETVTKSVPVTPAAPPAPVTPTPAAPPAPAAKSVSIGGSGVQWSRSPRPTYTNRDLQGQTRSIVVMIEANEKGTITQARVTRSSGLPALDDKILRAVRGAKFKPYKENGVAYAIRAEQPFELTLNPNG